MMSLTFPLARTMQCANSRVEFSNHTGNPEKNHHEGEGGMETVRDEGRE